MTKNTGSLDRVIRAVIGTALLTSFYFMQDTYWLLIGIVPLMTAFIGFCPLYPLCKCNTCESEACCKVEKK